MDVVLSEAEVRAAVGPRADFYLRKWKGNDRGGFNWAAFAGSGVWLGMPETPPAFERGVGKAVSLVCGAFGNRWYLSHVKHLVDATRATAPKEEQCLDTLRKRGGATIVGGLGLLAVFLVALIAAGLVADAVLGWS
jgi:hypothetical protein